MNRWLDANCRSKYRSFSLDIRARGASRAGRKGGWGGGVPIQGLGGGEQSKHQPAIEGELRQACLGKCIWPNKANLNPNPTARGGGEKAKS